MASAVMVSPTDHFSADSAATAAEALPPSPAPGAISVSIRTCTPSVTPVCARAASSKRNEMAFDGGSSDDRVMHACTTGTSNRTHPRSNGSTTARTRKLMALPTTRPGTPGTNGGKSLPPPANEMRIGALATTRRCGVRSARECVVRTAHVFMVSEQRVLLPGASMRRRSSRARSFRARAVHGVPCFDAGTYVHVAP